MGSRSLAAPTMKFSRWSLIAAQLPGRTDNDVKNHWNTKLKKKLSGMGIDPVTHKPFSHLMAEIATTLAPPQVAHLAEAALGCFKDEMLHLLTKKRIDFGTRPLTTSVGAEPAMAFPPPNPNDDKDDTIHRIKLGLSRAIMQEPGSSDKAWGTMMGSAAAMEPSDGLAEMCAAYPAVDQEFRYDGLTYGDDAEGCAPEARALAAVVHSCRRVACRRKATRMRKRPRVEKMLEKKTPAFLVLTAFCGIYVMI